MQRVTFAMVMAVALGAAFDADARLMSKRDVTEIADRAAQRVVTDDLETINMMLSAQGLDDAEISSTSQRLISRLVRDVRAYATGLYGHSFGTFDQAERKVHDRWLILRFSALNAPHAYARGMPLRYVVNEVEAARMERALLATWIEREPLLRKKLDEMVLMNEIQPREVAAVRQWARKLAMQRGKETIEGIEGAAFFSSADADYFLECAVVAEIERVRADLLADPIQRPRFIEDAVVEFGASEESAVVEYRPRRQPQPSFDTAKSSATTDGIGIDFNK